MLSDEQIEEIALDYAWTSYKSFARAIESAARAQAFDEAAKLCDSDPRGVINDYFQGYFDALSDTKEEIRALINKEQAQ